MPHIQAGALRVAADAAHLDVGSLRKCRIQNVDARLIAVGCGIEFIAHAIVERNLRGHSPLILCIAGKLRPAH